MKSKMLPLWLSVFALVAATAARAAEPYHFIKEIPIGGEGGWDYLTVDSAGQRLYVSHATRVVVIDLNSDQVVGEIANTPGVHGIAIAADLGRGFTSNGRANQAGVVDLKTLKTVNRIETGQNPDAMLYEPARKEVYMFNGRSQSATVIDAKSEKVVTTIPLGGKPEFATVDSAAGQIFNNLEDESQVAVIDTQSHQVVHRWLIAPGRGASGMAIDVAHHRLFIGCANKLMVMLDNTSGKVVASVPIGQGVDANAFDPGTQLAFASCGDGTVTIAHEDTPDKLTVVQTLKTEIGARTMTLNLATHRIYLSAATFAAPAAGQRRGRLLPGSFKVLVYGMDETAKK